MSLGQERKKVLVIDDEIDLSLLLQSYLTKKGYDVDIKHTIEEGLATIQSSTPVILFLDNNLPDGIGWEIAPQLAKDYPQMFIFFLSAFHPSQPDMPENSRFIVVEKPVSMAGIDKLFVAYNL
jgi:DNA-binding response OmpR family regulator